MCSGRFLAPPITSGQVARNDSYLCPQHNKASVIPNEAQQSEESLLMRSKMQGFIPFAV